MVGNFSPTSFYGVNGCLPWLWVLSAVFQFWLLMPWVILLYYKTRLVTYTILTLLSAGSLFLTMYYAWIYDFQVGLLSPQNIKNNVFDLVFKSPLTKFHLLLMSFAFSRFYFVIQKHKAQSPAEQNWLMKRVYKSNSLIFKLVLWGFLMSTFLFYIFSSKKSLLLPPLWSRFENTAYYGFGKFVAFMDLFLLMFILLTDNAPAVKTVFSSGFAAVYAKLSLAVYLVFPTVMLLFV